MKEATAIIKKFNMKPHPEGGYYIETYRSSQKLTVGAGKDTKQRDASTAIMFLLNKNDKSHWHMIDADEHWSFCGGAPIQLFYITDAGELITTLLGNPFIHESAVPIATVPKNHWFAAEVLDKSTCGLVSCVVSPGFEFEGFKLAKQGELIKTYPQHEKIISRLTSPSIATQQPLPLTTKP